MHSEQDLVRRARTGDQAAFSALVTAYEGRIYMLALRYLGNRDDAQDAAQEVFLRVFRFLDGFKEESNFSTWIYRIAVNVCKDLLMQKIRRAEQPLEQKDEDNEDYALPIPDERYAPETVFEAAQLRKSLCDAILSLPEAQRQIIILRDVQGLSYEEIGEILFLERGTVKSRIARARGNLRKLLLQTGNISAFSSSNPAKGGESDANLQRL